ncbi:carbon dioxide concentrating mechanism protein [Argonema antarcticum]|uniref:carbon dioxide concentrating mechanism protein n=1 Tax=Argonema antarcticum TaxID=2942763 RepID=UPI0020128647|nr:carbon dioxide concentrating mechanism protein [Argonema antarcticum]MCL1472865.1 carbon dioxide concentrating mechanism protein [Argonema antarcticum A004/B2]
MQLPPLQPIANMQSYVSGDVTIDPSAAIAPGVLLIADANSRIVIAAGACIGMGSIIDAREGTLEIQAGAVLGAGVLVVGKGKIGAKACIGSATTIFFDSIEAGQVVPSGSLIGDSSRQIIVPLTPSTATNSASASKQNKTTLPTITILPCTDNGRQASIPADDKSASTLNNKPSNPYSPEASKSKTSSESAPTPTGLDSPAATPVQVAHGQAHLNRLMLTLFPHNQSLKRPLQDGKTD